MKDLILSPLLLPVKEKLTADPDSEIATTSLRVSLMCPVCLDSREKFGGPADPPLFVPMLI